MNKKILFIQPSIYDDKGKVVIQIHRLRNALYKICTSIIRTHCINCYYNLFHSLSEPFLVIQHDRPHNPIYYSCIPFFRQEIKAQKKTFQREPLDEKSFFHFSELLSRDDFFLIIGTASLAYSVWHHKRSTLAALYQARNCHLPVCSTLVTSCF